MDNRPPKHLRTLKRGDVREDGRVFWQYNKPSKDGEMWLTQEAFDKKHKREVERNREWVQANKKARAVHCRNYTQKLYSTPEGRLLACQRGRIWKALKGNKPADHKPALLGCTIGRFKAHLESLFKDGMTWDNYGEWHVDHIKPLSLFQLKLDSEQRAAFNYLNTQPLWAKENLQKRNKYNNQPTTK
jgi:hypothetical protein